MWSKTNLGMQHTHLELLLNLTYAITKKNKNISIINTYGNYKIVINSPEVCFRIKRQYAEVGCKTLIIFRYKNSFMQILQKCKKQFIKRFTS
jgi:hypothetical protein